MFCGWGIVGVRDGGEGRGGEGWEGRDGRMGGSMDRWVDGWWW